MLSDKANDEEQKGTIDVTANPELSAAAQPSYGHFGSGCYMLLCVLIYLVWVDASLIAAIRATQGPPIWKYGVNEQAQIDVTSVLW